MPYYKNEILLKNFGNHIRKIRISKGYTQESLSYDAELDISQIGRIERGKINPSLYVLYRLSKALDVSLKELLDF
ncbi:MAG: hypothetical protein A3K10_05920 [Bacteroidetes bacterium RIFCSPLOWO2_12_FULL_31_6]|nr:MAG: hypothetical protein A3K10_05920 [Bacteroidetes bacterium RIFCSPLOWO2_12_FULL_31_6]